MAGRAEGYPKAARLRRRSEFVEIQKRGRRVHTPHFVVLFQRRSNDTVENVRLGITVSKKVGNSVQRNRVKRLVREVFRRRGATFPAGHDVVVIAKAGAPTLAYRDVVAELGGARPGGRS